MQPTKKKLTHEEKLKVIAKMPMGELKFRRALITGAIKACRARISELESQIGNHDTNRSTGDTEMLINEYEMISNSVEVYREQLQRIDNGIKQKNRKTKRHNEPVEIQCSVGKIGARGSL